MEGAAARRVLAADPNSRSGNEDGAMGSGAGGAAPMNPVTVNPPVATPFFFYGTAAVMIIGGILVITRKNAVHSALALITTLLAQAALYLMLYAPFVAGVQIILYAGGIMVLFLFVIMLVSVERAEKEKQFNKQWIVAIVATFGLGLLFVLVFTRSTLLHELTKNPVAQLTESNNTQQMGYALYGNY